MTTGPGPSPQQQQPGWYPDPWKLAEQRWWDGVAWTPQTHPPTGPAAEPPPPPAPPSFEKAPMPPGYGAAPGYSTGYPAPGYGGTPGYGPGGPGYPAPPAAPRVRVPVAAQVIAFAGAGLTFAGSLMPWATLKTGFLDVSVNGTDVDGSLTLLCSLAIGVLLVVASTGRAVPAMLGVALGLGVLCAIVAIANIADVPGSFGDSDDDGFGIEVGSGLYVTLVGGGAAAVGSLLGLLGRTKPAPAAGW